MRNLKKLILVSGTTAVIALTAVTGCQTNSGSADRTAGRTLDDKEITAKIEDNLKREPVYKFTGVDVKTFAGVVQLSGFVGTEDQKRRAEQVAEQVPGVSRVMNSIALKPTAQDLMPTGRTNRVNEPIPATPVPPQQQQQQQQQQQENP